MVEIYKNGEAKLTRRVAYYGLLALTVWGFRQFAVFLDRFRWAHKVILGGFDLPIYGRELSFGVLLAIALNVVVAVMLFRWINSEKPATVLIDTETETRKVSWPTWDDARQSTIVVLVFVALTAVFLTVTESILTAIFNLVFTRL